MLFAVLSPGRSIENRIIKQFVLMAGAACFD
jgi:hypothetical protein